MLCNQECQRLSVQLRELQVPSTCADLDLCHEYVISFLQTCCKTIQGEMTAKIQIAPWMLCVLSSMDCCLFFSCTKSWTRTGTNITCVCAFVIFSQPGFPFNTSKQTVAAAPVSSEGLNTRRVPATADRKNGYCFQRKMWSEQLSSSAFVTRFLVNLPGLVQNRHRFKTILPGILQYSWVPANFWLHGCCFDIIHAVILRKKESPLQAPYETRETLCWQDTVLFLPSKPAVWCQAVLVLIGKKHRSKVAFQLQHWWTLKNTPKFLCNKDTNILHKQLSFCPLEKSELEVGRATCPGSYSSTKTNNDVENS